MFFLILLHTTKFVQIKYNNEYVCNTQLYNIWNQMN